MRDPLWKLLFCAVLVTLPVFAFATVSDSLRADNARIPDAPPSARMRVAYFDLHNDGEQAIRIVAIDSADFGRAVMHQTVFENGVAKMRALTEVLVPAHGSFQFAPGAAHVMLSAPTRALGVNDRVRLSLLLASGDRFEVELPIRAD